MLLRWPTRKLEYLKRQKSATSSSSMKSGNTAADRATAATLAGTRKMAYPGILPMNHPIVGSPDDIAGEIKKLSALASLLNADLLEIIFPSFRTSCRRYSRGWRLRACVRPRRYRRSTGADSFPHIRIPASGQHGDYA